MILRTLTVAILLAFAAFAAYPVLSVSEEDRGAYGRACEAFNQGAYSTAFEDLMPFAVHGDATAQFGVAEMLRTGSGTPRNRKEAIIWYRRAAEQEHSAAQCNLGVALYNGWGARADPQAAIDWWLHAALNGNAHAMFNLGTVIARGRHVTRDLVRAYWWLTESSVKGYPGAEDVLVTLRKVMTVRQISDAQKLTRHDAMDFTRRKYDGAIPRRRPRP